MKPFNGLAVANGAVELKIEVVNQPSINICDLVRSNVRRTLRVLITPDMARDLLANNNNGNRSFKRPYIAIYALAMREGRWRDDNGNRLGFLKDGQISDGQNRLKAVVDANVAIWFYLELGLTDEDRKTSNICTSFTSSDEITIFLPHIKDRIAYAAVSTFLQRLLTNTYHRMGIDERALLMEPFNVDYDVIRLILCDGRFKIAPVRAAFILARKMSPDVIDAFAKEVNTGVGLAHQDPALKLREYVTRLKTVGGARMQDDIFRVTCGAILARIQNRSMSKVVANDTAVRLFAKTHGYEI